MTQSAEHGPPTRTKHTNRNTDGMGGGSREHVGAQVEAERIITQEPSAAAIAIVVLSRDTSKETTSADQNEPRMPPEGGNGRIRHNDRHESPAELMTPVRVVASESRADSLSVEDRDAAALAVAPEDLVIAPPSAAPPDASEGGAIAGSTRSVAEGGERGAARRQGADEGGIPRDRARPDLRRSRLTQGVRDDRLKKIYIADEDVDGNAADAAEQHRPSMPFAVLMDGVRSPLNAQSAFVEEVALHYFVEHVRIEEHFAALQRFLLGGRGSHLPDFASRLDSSLQTGGPLHMFGLEAMVKAAMSNGIPRASESRAECLRYGVNYDADDMGSADYEFTPAILRHIHVEYAAPSPVGAVIDDVALQSCYLVHHALLEHYYEAVLLRNLWLTLTNAPRGAMLHRLSMLRHELQQTANALHELLHAGMYVEWRAFCRKLRTRGAGRIVNLSQLRLAYQVFVVAVRHRLFLDSSRRARQVRETMGSFYRVVNDLCRLVARRLHPCVIDGRAPPEDALRELSAVASAQKTAVAQLRRQVGGGAFRR